MFTVAQQRPEKYTIEEEISYLLDKQDSLKETLNRYNSKASDFEDRRDDFFKRLYDRNQIRELKEALRVFDRIAYVETDLPEFIFVDVTDIYDDMPIVEDEYHVIESEDLVEETVTKKLNEQTVDRILKTCTAKKDDLFKSALKNAKEHVLFKLVDKSIVLNNTNYKMMYLNNDVVDIQEYSDELFEIMKEHYSKKDIVTELGIKPVICENQKQIICSWA